VLPNACIHCMLQISTMYTYRQCIHITAFDYFTLNNQQTHILKSQLAINLLIILLMDAINNRLRCIQTINKWMIISLYNSHKWSCRRTIKRRACTFSGMAINSTCTAASQLLWLKCRPRPCFAPYGFRQAFFFTGRRPSDVTLPSLIRHSIA